MISNEDVVNVLNLAARKIEERGWRKGNALNSLPICASRALYLAAEELAYYPIPLFSRAKEYILTSLGLDDESLAEWNDCKGSQEIVIKQFQMAARRITVESATV